ncbi:MAG TPA: hypothetical protein VLM79_05925, partial [Kofleriaceae bacterium]|nr:hypothetical protein [Kofleriaceae bacterium]
SVLGDPVLGDPCWAIRCWAIRAGRSGAGRSVFVDEGALVLRGPHSDSSPSKFQTPKMERRLER